MNLISHLLKKTESKAASLGISIVEAINSLPELDKLITKLTSTKESNKLIKKVSDLPIDIESYKQLIDPNAFNSGAVNIITLLTERDLSKLKSCVEYSATQYIQSVGNKVSSPEQVAKLKNYDNLLKAIDGQFDLLELDAYYRTSEAPKGILATKDHAFDIDESGNPVWARKFYAAADTPTSISAKFRLSTKAGQKNYAKKLRRKEDYLKEHSEIYF